MGASPNGLIAPSVTADGFGRRAASPNGLIARENARELDADVIAAALTLAFSGNVTLAASLLFSAASAKVIPGATSLLFRNNADSASNLTITDAGLITAVRGNVALTVGNLVFGAASAKILPGATSLLFRNNADSQTNVTILDNGNVTARGDIAGVNGTFSGTVTAAGVVAVEPVAAITADGAITLAAQSKKYFITKAGVAAMTIVDPTATTHDGVTLSFISTTANAHTLDNSAGSGFFSSGGGTKDVATFGGAIGDGLTIIAYQGKWYIDPRGTTNITLG